MKQFPAKLVCVFLGLLSAVVVAFCSSGVIRYMTSFGGQIEFGDFIPSVFYNQTPPKWIEHIKEEEKLLFPAEQGDFGLDASEALWRNEPENPAYFSEYAHSHLLVHNQLPNEYLETARRIDPENSYFTYLAAAAKAKDCVKMKKRKGRRVNGEIVYDAPPDWEILEREAYEQVIHLITEANQQPDFRTYGFEMAQKRMSFMRFDHWLDHMDSRILLGNTTTTSFLYLYRLREPVAARAWELAEQSDSPALKEWLGHGDVLIARFLSSKAYAIVEELVIAALASSAADSFAPAATKAGLADEAKRWQDVANRLHIRKEARNHYQSVVDGQPTNMGVLAGGLGGVTIDQLGRYASEQPPLTSADVKPSRMHEREITTMLFSLATWLILVISLLLTASYRFRVPSAIRREANEKLRALGGRDWAWILGCGVILPFAYVVCFNRLTPWGCMDFGMIDVCLTMMAAHFLGLLLIWWTVPALIIRWRLWVHHADCVPPTRSWLALVMIALTLCLIPLVGYLSYAHAAELVHMDLEAWQDNVMSYVKRREIHAVYAAMLIPVLWILQSVIRAAFSRPDRLMVRAVMARSYLSVHVVAMVLIASLFPPLNHSIQQWHERNVLMKSVPQESVWTNYEHQVTLQHRKEIREIFGMGE
jgi:hypothetical protein